jgi:alkylation response protein AidB-like acyl-CoA dehydrogenase
VISYSADELLLRDTVRDFFAGEVPSTTLLRADSGYEMARWKRASAELGLAGLVVGEELGGQGFGPAALGVVMDEAGRTLASGPLFGTVALAVSLLNLAPASGVRNELLTAIATGQRTATFAWHDMPGAPVHHTDTADGPVLNGSKAFVVDGHSTDILLVTAQDGDGDGVCVYAVDGTAPGLDRRRVETLDLTRPQARLDFTDTPARPIVPATQGADVVDRALDLARVALANENAGAARRALEQAVAYSATRRQFGRPIGSFQAIKHRCADLLVEIEAAWSLARHAALVADNPAASHSDIALAAAMAAAETGDALAHAAAENIQIHGGIGFTWEHPAHLYFRRAKASQVLLGLRADHRDRVVRELERRQCWPVKPK